MRQWRRAFDPRPNLITCHPEAIGGLVGLPDGTLSQRPAPSTDCRADAAECRSRRPSVPLDRAASRRATDHAEVQLHWSRDLQRGRPGTTPIPRATDPISGHRRRAQELTSSTFVTVADAAGCHANDTGTYKYALDGTKTRLTLTAVDDPCAARTAAFSGDWTRSACPDPRGWCLGDLAPGDHQSVVFTPFTPAPSWKYDYGEMSYTVPEWVVEHRGHTRRLRDSSNRTRLNSPRSICSLTCSPTCSRPIARNCPTRQSVLPPRT